MRGLSHVVSGAAAYLVVDTARLLPGSPSILTAASLTVLAAGSAAFCDLDQCGSTSARTFGPLTECLAACIRAASRGHREGTHSVIGAVSFTGFTLTAVLLSSHAGQGGSELASHVGGLAAVALISTLAVASAIQAVWRVHHYLTDLIAASCGILIAVCHSRLPGIMTGLPVAVGLGVTAHILGDMLTVHGCPLAWPISERCVHLLPRRLRISTGHRPETVIRIALTVVAAWLAARLLTT